MDFEFKDHDLSREQDHPGVLYERRPLRSPDGSDVAGLYSVWISLDNPAQFNSYTTDMIKGVILGMRRASNDRGCVAVVFTATGHKAFCTGGNTKEYAEYYAGRPEEYRQYMRLFNDMVTSILHCDKPVICRVNGMRIAGGQEIGMACDFTVASDLAMFGQAGPRHGSAPDGGSTDFLPLFVGVESAMESCTICQPWTAHQAVRLGLISRAVPVLKVDGEWTPNPLAVTDRWLDPKTGRIVFGEKRTGEEAAAGKALLKSGEIDLSLLDETVTEMIWALAQTFPGCLAKTIESVRKHKLEHWDRNRETNRAWLGLNMLTEARAGFRAFNEGSRECRDADVILLRQRLAEGVPWGEELVDDVLARAHGNAPSEEVARS